MENWIKNRSETQEINQIDSINSLSQLKLNLKKLKNIFLVSKSTELFHTEQFAGITSFDPLGAHSF